jgi:hypothetical protein
MELFDFLIIQSYRSLQKHAHYTRLTISAYALTESMFVILTFTWSPRLALFMKTRTPLTRAMPFPCGLICLMCTSYSLPTMTGQLPLPPLFLAFLGLLFLGLIGRSLHC